MASKNISFEEGLSVMTKAVDRVINLVEGLDDKPISSEEYMLYYSVVYELCLAGPLMAKHSEELWDLYRKTFEENINNKVSPSLRGKKDEDLLRELQNRWSNHKIIVRWLSRFFYYLERIRTKNTHSPSIEQTGLFSFYELTKSAKEFRYQDLVKNVMDIYAATGVNSTEHYVQDCEEALLRNSAEFYSAKASIWIETESYGEYIAKANNCLKHERDIVSLYLPIERRSKLIQVVEHELLNVHASKLQQNEIFA